MTIEIYNLLYLDRFYESCNPIIHHSQVMKVLRDSSVCYKLSLVNTDGYFG